MKQKLLQETFILALATEATMQVGVCHPLLGACFWTPAPQHPLLAQLAASPAERGPPTGHKDISAPPCWAINGGVLHASMVDTPL